METYTDIPADMAANVLESEILDLDGVMITELRALNGAHIDRSLASVLAQTDRTPVSAGGAGDEGERLDW